MKYLEYKNLFNIEFFINTCFMAFSYMVFRIYYELISGFNSTVFTLLFITFIIAKVVFFNKVLSKIKAWVRSYFNIPSVFITVSGGYKANSCIYAYYKSNRKTDHLTSKIGDFEIEYKCYKKSINKWTKKELIYKESYLLYRNYLLFVDINQ